MQDETYSATGRYPGNAAQAAAVMEQLERILTSRHFALSQRYPAFLRFVVETVIADGGSSLRERLIGNAVLHKRADYDTNADPTVRITAAEVRKRLAQYYQEANHRDEIRIQLQSGSYIPQFSPPASSGHGPTIGTESQKSLRSALLSVWSPAKAANTKTLICLGVPSSFRHPDARQEETLLSWVTQCYTVSFGDVLAQDRVIRLLSRLGVDYVLGHSEEITFSTLRDQPTVLVGALSNRWTMKATQHLRYRIVPECTQADMYVLKDSLSSEGDKWVVDGRQHISEVDKDYGLVASFLDPGTGQPTWIVAGIGAAGTVAASEFLTSEVHMTELLKGAPAEWSGRSFEAVLESEVVDGISGQPRLLTSTFW